MQIPLTRAQPNIGKDSVSRKFSQKVVKQKPTQKIDSQIDLEIERSLYFLGRALYRFSLLQQERSKK